MIEIALLPQTRPMLKKIVPRDNILTQIKPFISKELIKVISGQRRVGKSFVLKQIQNQSEPKSIYIDKELYDFDFIKNYHDLIQYVEEKTSLKKHALFIDEIQEIDEFEKALRHFQSKGIYDIYCSGSNAQLLSGELATYLSGRYIEFQIHSLSFQEFKTFHDLKNEDQNTFDNYLIYGGMPYLRNLNLSEEIAYQYLKSIYQSIILKDVVKRYSLRNIKFLENLVVFLCNNIGSITSSHSISKFLKSQQMSVNVTTVINYIEALKNSFFIYEVPRFDIEGRKVFEINNKYYFEDIGIRNSIIGYNQARDEGKLLENIVFGELKRKHYQIYVGALKDKEIDFVAIKNGEKIYVQVCLDLSNRKVIDREFGNLALIKDNYKKIVVSKNANSLNTIDGIIHLSVKDFIKEI